MGNSGGLDALYKALRNHYKGRKRELPYIIKAKGGHILRREKEVIARFREGMMEKTNVGVSQGTVGERDEEGRKQRAEIWRSIKREAETEQPPIIRRKDVSTAVKYLKAAKGAPGRDGIQGWVYGLLDEGER